MAVAINTVLLGGHLTRDPQVRFLANEQAVANFALAINRRFKGSDGQMKDEVTFVDIECWGRTADLVGQYLTKGRACFIQGRLKLDQWQDKEGKARQRLKVIADSVQFLDSKGRDADASSASASASAVTAPDGAVPTADAVAAPARPPGVGDDEPPF